MSSTTVWTAQFDRIERELDELRADALTGWSDVDLSWSIERLQRIENRVAAEKLRRLGEFDERQAYLAQGARSAGDWAARNLNLTPGQGKTLADTADRLQDLPETADSLAQGKISCDHAAAAARAANDVLGEDLAELDRRAADNGEKMDRNKLRQDLDAFAADKNKDHLAEKERAQQAKRSVRRWEDADGMARADVRLPGWMMAAFDAAIAPLARKTSADDTRSPEQRRADALHSLCEQTLDAGQLPEVAAQRPHLIVITHRDPARPATLDGFGQISPATEAMIACDAHTTEVVVDHRGHPLVVKPTKKDPTTRQRLAVIARDRRCVGCGAAASRCQVHHVRWRRKGGLTVVSNLVLVCTNCHWHIHHLGWQVTRDGDGRYHAGPRTGRPAQLDEPLRHTA